MTQGLEPGELFSIPASVHGSAMICPGMVAIPSNYCGPWNIPFFYDLVKNQRNGNRLKSSISDF